MNGLLVGISYCGTHNKGDEAWSSQAVMVPPHEHAQWLLEAIDLYWDKAASLTTHQDRSCGVVALAVGCPALLDMTAPGEREVMLRAHRQATVLSHPHNEGHQVGAATALRLGLETAGTWGRSYYLHTAEDILPRPGAVEAMVEALDGGSDYAGYCWTDCLNCSFFACRTTALAGCFDREAVRQHQGLEHYLTYLLRDKKKTIFDGGGRGRYLTTHDHAQYQRWLKKLPDDDAPPSVRNMADYEKNREHLEKEAELYAGLS